MNLSKFRQLALNSLVPGAGVGLVFWLAFGLTWWLIPTAILVGIGSSLVISHPKKMLNEAEEAKALEGAA